MENMVKLLHEKELLETKLEKLLYGSIEIREKGDSKYIYVSYRYDGVKYTKYAGVYSNELYNLILENNIIAKDYKKRLRELNKTLKELDHQSIDLSNDVKINLDLAKRNLVDSIYKQSILEGIATTYINTETIISGGKVKDMSVSDIVKIVNLKRAWEFIFNEGVIVYPTNYHILCQINKIIQDGYSFTAGRLRTVPVSVSGTNYIPPLPIESLVIESINEILNSNQSEYDIAIELLLYVMKSQLFIDGNKRTALIFANHYLISRGYGLISIPTEHLDEYRKLLINYYEGKDKKIKKFIKEKGLIKMKNGNI